AGGDLVGGVGVAPAGHLLHLLVEGAAERALLLQAGAAGVVHPEPGRSDLHRGLLGADLVPAYHQRSAVRDPECVGDLGRRRRPADLGEVLAVARGQVGVVAVLGAVAAAGEPVEPAAGAADVRAGARLGEQDALDPELVDRALDGLLGDPEGLRDRGDGGQPFTGGPVTAAD